MKPSTPTDQSTTFPGALAPEMTSSSSKSSKMKVLIVGCGLAGLATALGLTRKDKHIQVVLVERRGDFKSRGATMGLAPSGQAALQEIAPSVLDKLKREGVFMPYTDGYMLPWWRVRDALLDEVKAIEGGRITIHLGVSIDTVKETTPLATGNGDKVTNSTLIATFQDSDLTIEADVVIGADGVHSYVRCDILDLPPACSTGTVTWRGSVDTHTTEALGHFRGFPIGKLVSFGETMIASYFNFHPKVEGTTAWVFTCRNSSDSIQIESGTTTPLDLIQSYMDSIEEPGDELLRNYADIKLVLQHTHEPSELTWSTEMAVVDLTQEFGWGGKGRITLIGDAAHSIRPASGLGGSLAFEDSVLVSRAITSSSTGTSSMDGSNGIANRLREFETQRLPRCRSISRDQTLRSTLAYTIGFAAVPQWDPQYKKWVFAGPDASMEPPVCETTVFGDLA